MKSRLVGIVVLLILAVLGVSVAIAQDETLRSVAGDKWVITAQAGGVNYVEGEVGIVRTLGKSGMLLKGDSVQVGDRVTTGANGRAEILLNPGSYLRIAENSAFEFKTTSLEDLQIYVERGSVMLEVFAANDFKVSVNTAKQNYDLVDTGIYRIDVAADGIARLEVWKGKAEAGETVLKGGRTTSSSNGVVAKFDRDERDAFETWSRDRAKELAKGTNDLRDKSLRTSLMSSYLGGRWDMYNSFGLWVYNRSAGRYSFLPFGYGWSSPYGFGFGTDIWWYRLPSAVYYVPQRTYRTPTGTNPPATNPPTGSGPTAPSTNPRRGWDRREDGRTGDRRTSRGGERTVRPPYESLQRTRLSAGSIGDDGFGGGSRSTFPGSRRSSPASDAPARTSAPAAGSPTRTRSVGSSPKYGRPVPE